MTTCYLSPIGNSPRTTASGAPLSGGTISTYQAGTTTQVATYTDNTGATPQSNPITLNTLGLPSSPIWLARGQSYKFVIKDSLGNTISTYDTLSGVNDPTLGAVVSRAYAEYTSNADLTTLIPFDDTIPQITEGTQVLSATLTPSSATNRLRVRVSGWGYSANSGDAIGTAVFVNGATNASAASISAVNPIAGAGDSGPIYLEYEYAPGVTTAQAITVRVGGTVGTIRLNGTTASRRFGGVARATLILEEISA